MASSKMFSLVEIVNKKKSYIKHNKDLKQKI